MKTPCQTLLYTLTSLFKYYHLNTSVSWFTTFEWTLHQSSPLMYFGIMVGQVPLEQGVLQEMDLMNVSIVQHSMSINPVWGQFYTFIN